MTKVQERLLRIRARVNKKARAEYEELQERRLHATACRKAQEFLDREREALVEAGKAVIIRGEIVMLAEPATFHTSAAADDYSEVPVHGGIEVIEVTEVEVTPTELKKIITEHYALDDVADDEPGVLDPTVARRIMTPKKKEADEKRDDASALMYFAGRNSGR